MQIKRRFSTRRCRSLSTLAACTAAIGGGKVIPGQPPVARRRKPCLAQDTSPPASQCESKWRARGQYATAGSAFRPCPRSSEQDARNNVIHVTHVGICGDCTIENRQTSRVSWCVFSTISRLQAPARSDTLLSRPDQRGDIGARSFPDLIQ